MSKKNNLEGHGFHINPERINRKGRPKKSFRIFNDKLKEEGYEPLKKKDLIEAYSLIFSASEATLKDVAKDKEQPFALRLIIMELSDKRLRAKAMQDYREYMFNTDDMPVVNYNVEVSRDEAKQILADAKEEF